ncbi:MAG: PDZ domain-containing protein [Alistipes sp.]|nr:PDZ domain-containing protein [Alistipes sp.]
MRFRLWHRLLFVVAALTATVESYAQTDSRVQRDFELGESIEVLANIMREFEVGFVDDVSAKQLLNSAARGMITATDPYSEYLSEEAMSNFEILTTGRYGGVGSLIRKRDDYVIFAQPYKGSPSDLAGIKVGDKILAIDGQSMQGKDVSVISSHLKGEPESDVEVVIERNIDSSVDTLRLTRKRISIPSVNYAGIIRDGVGYISHNDFIEGSYDEMRRAVEQLMATDSLRGIVLDYRSNGGGVMQEAVDIASLFVPRGSRVLSLMGRDSSSLKHLETRYAPLAEDIPVVVLVSGNSASASEILAGALQDMDRAVIMGSRTYGKGLVQGTRYVGYNSYLKYTTAKYYTPSGRCVQSRNYATMRNEGSVTTVPDSLISEFRTRGGRKVYDGGGIVPDVKIEPKYVSRFAVTLYAMGLMEDWADKYMRTHHTDKIDVRTFTITNEDYADFCSYIADKEIPYESETRQALKALERAMERDLYTESLAEAVEQLKSQLKDDKLSNMQTYRGEIVDALNSDIVMRHAYNEGVQERIAATDEEVDRAIELILNAEEYQRILASQDVDKR